MNMVRIYADIVCTYIKDRAFFIWFTVYINIHYERSEVQHISSDDNFDLSIIHNTKIFVND